MRKVKFRAFDKKRTTQIGDIVWINLTTHSCGFWIITSHNEKKIAERSIDDVELMQYTGLKDKNDVEIYEGDIISVVSESLKADGNIEAFVSEVTFNEGSFNYWKYEDYLHSRVEYPLAAISSENGKYHEGSHFCEVIGNVYKNKELLK